MVQVIHQHTQAHAGGYTAQYLNTSDYRPTTDGIFFPFMFIMNIQVRFFVSLFRSLCPLSLVVTCSSQVPLRIIHYNRYDDLRKVA